MLLQWAEGAFLLIYEWLNMLNRCWNSSTHTLSPNGIAIAVSPVADYENMLFDDESVCIKNAVSKRRKEFSTGRMLCRKCFDILGKEHAAVLQGTNREPLWPEGLKGSISHTDSLCVAVVTDREEILSVGVDIENQYGVTPDLWEHIFSADEILYIKESSSPSMTAAVIFSAKETFYKMQYPLTGKMLDFKDVEIKLDGRSFDVGFKGQNKVFEKSLSSGHFMAHDTHVLTISYMVKNG